MIFGKGGLFGPREDKGDDVGREYGPLGVPLGGAIEIDLLPLQGDSAGAEPGMALPEGGVFIAVAYGEARLDASTVLSRYYDDDDRMLQVLTASGRQDDAIDDCSLYHPWDSVVPASSADWNEWTGPSGLIGQPSYDADGIVFERFWGEGGSRAELVEFTEDVTLQGGTRTIHQRCMLYARPLGATREMLLINIERDIEQRLGGRSIEFMLGYGLAPADVRRV